MPPPIGATTLAPGQEESSKAGSCQCSICESNAFHAASDLVSRATWPVPDQPVSESTTPAGPSSLYPSTAIKFSPTRNSDVTSKDAWRRQSTDWPDSLTLTNTR